MQQTPISQAIILAGGLGTRLRDSVPDLPKCMAPVAGKPFLFHVINYWRSRGIEKFIFSLGYKHEIIEEYLAAQFSTLNYQCSIEEEPLGTGGAIALGCRYAQEDHVLVTNGDTLFKVDTVELSSIHLKNKADATVALKPMENFDRYGVVEINGKGAITGFREKEYRSNGLINGGTYLLNRDKFIQQKWPAVFSFEKLFLESNQFNLFGSVQDKYFIDIGIPEDYERAQTELAKQELNLAAIDKNWTLFIDRDGVINPEKKDDYILNRDEFRFYDGIKDAIQRLSNTFGKLILISNQRGVGRGLMTMEDLAGIDEYLLNEVENSGGRIDAIYYCTSADPKHPDRKPNPGMIYQAFADNPSIDLTKALMIGNKASDMQLGRNAGVYTIFVATTNPDTQFPHPDIDLRFNSLPDFAKAL